ncbi:MAG: hypothetical protein ABR497_13090, partial [Kiritimatiellia bacterium]
GSVGNKKRLRISLRAIAVKGRRVDRKNPGGRACFFPLQTECRIILPRTVAGRWLVFSEKYVTLRSWMHPFAYFLVVTHGQSGITNM